MKDCLTSYLWARGMTLEQLAEQARVDAWSITCWCKGNRRPQTGKLIRVAKVLDVTCEKLLSMLDAEPSVKEECLALRRSRECRTFLRLVGGGCFDTGPRPGRLLARLRRQQRDLDRACAAIEKQLEAQAASAGGNSSQGAQRRKYLIRIKRRRSPQSAKG